MSFILDALRKSEHERQRQSGPGIADLQPVSVSQRLPLWAIALGALLLVNILAVLILVLRGQSQPDPVVASAPPAQPPAQAATPSAATQAPGPQAARADAVSPDPYALPPPVLPRTSPAEEQAQARMTAPAPQDTSSRWRRDPQLAVRQPAQESFEDTASEENLPSMNDVMLQGPGRVPELHLDIHVYSGAPAERFVFLNMRKYREGDATPEGTRIERITREGVVLNHRGLRYKMPRQ